MTELFNFGRALEILKEQGTTKIRKISRKGWHLPGMYLQLQSPDEHSKMTLTYIYMTIPGMKGFNTGGQADRPDQLVPWLASQTDMLAEDWFEIN